MIMSIVFESLHHIHFKFQVPNIIKGETKYLPQTTFQKKKTTFHTRHLQYTRV